MSAGFFLRAGVVLMLFGVVSGAFGAHALKHYLSAAQIEVWQTATNYLFYHALGLIGLGIWSESKPMRSLYQASGLLLLLGVLLFCGSLYLMLLTGMRQLAMITPIGGLLFILGWLSWLVALSSAGKDQEI